MTAHNRKAKTTERYYYLPNTVDLTSQERRALSLVWSEPADEPVQHLIEPETEHCAVLGYN